ncbi:MAG: hypothetical protein C0399_05930 [Syntrophus sp. (in: bacteria)]|nr:hypothetical protein [Syntrophus sp. (in: bacteria)]
MKKMHVILLAVLFVALATTAFAFGPGAGFMGRGGYGPDHGGAIGNVAGLNLSKEQTDKMWKLREKFYNDTQALRYELFQKRVELKTVYADSKADDAAILAKQKEFDAQKQKMQDKMVQFKLEQRKIFTPEQLTKLSEAGTGPGTMKGFGRASGHRGFGPGACGGM